MLRGRREKSSKDEDMQRGIRGGKCSTRPIKCCMEKSWELVEGMGSKSNLTMLASKRKDNKEVGCGVMLCPHEDSK